MGRATLDPTGPAAVAVTCMSVPGRAAHLVVGGPQVLLGAILLFAGGWPGGGAGHEGHGAADCGLLGPVLRTERPMLQTHGGAWNQEPARPHMTGALPQWGWGVAQAWKVIWGPPQPRCLRAGGSSCSGRVSQLSALRPSHLRAAGQPQAVGDHREASVGAVLRA